MKIDLLIMRHGEAAPFIGEKQDAFRALTERGLLMAKENNQKIIAKNIPVPKFIFTSGYLRAEQTMTCTNAWKNSEIVRDLFFSPMGTPEDIMDYLARFLGANADALDRSSGNFCMAIVGHNPCLGELRSFLLPNQPDLPRGLGLCELNWLQGKWDTEKSAFSEFALRIV